MDESKELIYSIEEKVKKIILLHQQDREEIVKLNRQIVTLENQITEQKSRIQEFILGNNKSVEITKSLEKGKENFDAEVKINELMREIDKCIGMLNTEGDI